MVGKGKMTLIKLEVIFLSTLAIDMTEWLNAMDDESGTHCDGNPVLRVITWIRKAKVEQNFIIWLNIYRVELSLNFYVDNVRSNNFHEYFTDFRKRKSTFVFPLFVALRKASAHNAK